MKLSRFFFCGVSAGAMSVSAADAAKPTRPVHPSVSNVEIWPGPDGYPWAGSGIKLRTRQALLRRTRSNELLATWTTGGFTGPVLRNFTMIARSPDDGRTWSHAGKFAFPSRGLFTTELFQPRPGEIHAFLQSYGFGAWMTQLQSFRAISRDDGQTWAGPFSIPGGIDNVWTGRGILLPSGRWLTPVSWAELIGNAWADRNHRYVCGAMLYDDSGETFRLCGHIRGGAHGWLIEPRIVELSDGRIVMLIRSQRDGWLWRSESAD